MKYDHWTILYKHKNDVQNIIQYHLECIDEKTGFASQHCGYWNLIYYNLDKIRSKSYRSYCAEILTTALIYRCKTGKWKYLNGNI